MKVPLPNSIASKISQDAVKFARQEMKGYGWSAKSLQALSPMNGDGKVGIQTSLKFLMYQEQGIKPFLMTWVDGRSIPMGCKSGDGPHFRRGGHVGEPGYVDIPHVGKVWRSQRWKHPGFKGKGFMQKGVERAIKENQALIDAYAKSIIKGGR